MAQAQAKRQLNAWYDAQTAKVNLSGIDTSAQKMPLKPRERLEFRIHVQVANIANLAFADQSQHIPNGAYREYTLQHADNHHPRQLTDWKAYSEDKFANGYALKLLLLPDGFKGTRLIIFAVEWRAIKGCRARQLKGAAIVRIAGSLPNENLSAKTKVIEAPKPRRTKAQRESRKILLRSLCVMFAPKKRKKAAPATPLPAFAMLE